MRWTYVQRVALAIGLLVAAALVLVTAGTQAQAQPPQQAAFITTTPTPNAGLIRGTVTDGGNGLPAADVEVCAITFANTMCTSTRSSGRYTLSPLPAGNFTVQFSAPDRFVDQCWDAASCENPTRLSVSIAEDFEAIDAVMQPRPGLPPTPTPTNTPTPTPRITPDPPVTPTPNVPGVDCSFVGYAEPPVVRVGELVTLSASVDCTCNPAPNYPVGSDCYFAVYELSRVDSDGLLDPLPAPIGPPGPLSVELQATTIGTGEARLTWYGEDARPQPGGGFTFNFTNRSVTIPIEVVAGDLPPSPTPTPPLGDFEAAISGRIAVLSTGDSVFGAQVCAQRSFPAFERCAFSASDGRYTIRDLQPGNYTVTATDPSRRFVDNCYGAQSCDDPERIGVDRNEQAMAIDIDMDPLFSASVPTPTPPAPFPEGSIAGRVLVDGEPRSDTEVCAITTITRIIARCAVSADDGFYVITGLATANYQVQARITVSTSPDFEFIEFCYRDDPGCDDNVSVGVVSPFSRNRIDLRISSAEFDEARITITPTPTPAVPFEPTPTPTPTSTATPTPGPVDPDAVVPYSEFDRSGPWADVPHVGTLGVGTYATGTYRFGSAVEPVLDLMTAYFGPPSGTLDQGRVTWWGPDVSTPVARIETDAANRLTAASINLEENARLGLEPVFLGDVWLFSGNFPLDAFGLDTDRFIYLEDDPAGNAIRCASDNFCTVQRVERDVSGQVTEFGNIIEFFADADSAESTRITGNVTADGRVQLRTAPNANAPTLRSIDLSGGVTAGIVGGTVTDAAGTSWVRLTEGRDPLSPAGWAPAEGLRVSPVADRLGPLPRLTIDPPELSSVIGRIHGDTWDDLALVLGIDDIQAGSGSGLVDDENGTPVLLARFVRENGAAYDLVISDRLPDETWQIRSTMRLRIGTDQVVISPGTGRCPWLGGAANDALFVADLDKDAVVAWEWRLGAYVGVDVTGMRCDLEDRG